MDRGERRVNELGEIERAFSEDFAAHDELHDTGFGEVVAVHVHLDYGLHLEFLVEYRPPISQRSRPRVDLLRTYAR